jgi:hypothetical protein
MVTKTAVLVGLFIVLIIGGRFLNNSSEKNIEIQTATTTNQKGMPQPESKSQAAQQKTVQKAPEESEETLAGCSTRLRQETTAAKREYEKGTLLVTFKSDITYTQAKDILATYGVSVQNEANAKSTFNSRHLITGAFTPGEEFTKVCLLKRDGRIAFAGLNLIFNLHQ